uniref:Uncharacterized protein n=1 Tax=Physcomitrium patens TaxID=3218 RepID=A0A2K1L0R7_PHYPA|nr:hypothetical protein PHYPA_002407 [Physcomitrium patens]
MWSDLQLCLDSKILLMRPKLYSANDRSFRDLRWFSFFKHLRQFETYQILRGVSGQVGVPFRDEYVFFEDT